MMSLNCPSSPIYHTTAEQKLRSKNAAKLYRFGSPKIRDLLREKCRIRVQEARQCSFEKSRNLDENLTSKISIAKILREELAEIESDINLQEKIYNELLEESNEWFVDQLEKEESYLINVAEWTDLICPVCQKSAVTFETITNTYMCTCGSNFSFNGGKEELHSILQSKIDLHEVQCPYKLSFFAEPRNSVSRDNVLSMMCEQCDYFCSL